jgi:hypothetical protein
LSSRPPLSKPFHAATTSTTTSSSLKTAESVSSKPAPIPTKKPTQDVTKPKPQAPKAPLYHHHHHQQQQQQPSATTKKLNTSSRNNSREIPTPPLSHYIDKVIEQVTYRLDATSLCRETSTPNCVPFTTRSSFNAKTLSRQTAVADDELTTPMVNYEQLTTTSNTIATNNYEIEEGNVTMTVAPLVVPANSTIIHSPNHTSSPIRRVQCGDEEEEKKQSIVLDAAYFQSVELEKRDVAYYKSLLAFNTNLLHTLCSEWTSVCATSAHVLPEDLLGDIRSACGLGKLLIDERFDQFNDLIRQCENSQNGNKKHETKEGRRGFLLI